MTPELKAVLKRLDALAADDPRLEPSRVAPNPYFADNIPDGWHYSADMEALGTHGGWWPGEWGATHSGSDNALGSISGFGLTDGPDPEVRWFSRGTIFEKDYVSTPCQQHQTPTAPLLIWTYGDATSVAHPTEAALLETFAITIETAGISHDAFPFVSPAFVDWVTQTPGEEEPAEHHETHRLIAARSKQWTTEHRCWLPGVMPLFTYENSLAREVAAGLLGVDVDRIHTRESRRRSRDL